MDNSLKLFLIAGGTMITCIVLALGFYVSGEARKTAMISANRVSELNTELSESSVKKYDGLEVMGSDVLSAALAVMSGERHDNIKVIVYTVKNISGINCIYDYKALNNAGYTTLISKIRNAGDLSYINPKGTFIGSISRDVNGAVTELIFKQI